jgi:mRNA-degrading endonuclease YafQ of YafQ-DinJ toxin-antitoxin module
VESLFWDKVAIFQANPFDAKLRTHKLSGQLKELWSFSVAYDPRVIFCFVDNQHVLFFDIGTHDDVY